MSIGDFDNKFEFRDVFERHRPQKLLKLVKGKRTLRWAAVWMTRPMTVQSHDDDDNHDDDSYR